MNKLSQYLIPNSGRDLFYVLAQVTLFALFVFFPKPVLKIPDWVQIAGLLFSLIGLLLSALSLWELRGNLTPYPSPVEQGVLIKSGPYSRIRHPIYTGVLLILFGWSLYSASITRLFISLVLTSLLYFKSRYEEHLLEERFDEYSDYREKTGRFLPKL